MAFLSSCHPVLGESNSCIWFEIIYHILRGTFPDLQTGPGFPVLGPLLWHPILHFFLAYTNILLYNNNSYYTILYNYLISIPHLECKLSEYKDQVCLNFLLTAILPVSGLVPCTKQVSKKLWNYFLKEA